MNLELIKSLCLISVIILANGLFFVVKKWPYGLDRTFSQHIARKRSSIIFYIALFCLALPLLTIFFLGYFAPQFELSIWFKLLIVSSMVCHFLCTLVPETGGTKSKVHRALAFSSAVLLLPSMFLVTFSHKIHGFVQTTCGVSFLIMLLIFIILVAHKAEHKYLLILQASYFVAFFAGILAVTYS